MKQMLHVFSDHIVFQIHDIACLLRKQRRLLTGVRNDRYLKPVSADRRDRQANAVNRDRTFLDDVFHNLWCRLNRHPDCIFFPFHVRDRSGAVNMPGYDMPTEASACRHRTFQIDFTSGMQCAK